MRKPQALAWDGWKGVFVVAREGKPKKPFFKKWWFWVIVLFVAFVAIGSSGSKDSDSADGSSGSAVQQSETSTEPTQESQEPVADPTPDGTLGEQNALKKAK